MHKKDRNKLVRNIFIWTFVSVLCMPLVIRLIMKSAWMLTPQIGINVVVVDKSGSAPEGESHSSFFWILEQQRFVKRTGSPYKADTDYYGFFPNENESYQVNDFKNMPDNQFDLLCDNSDVVYYTDTYGIYANDWYKNKKVEPQLLYGGMDENDLLFLKKMKEKGKLIIAEFNVMQPPTENRIRVEFENEFGIAWSGWSGCYFESLAPGEEKIPGWLIPAYTSQNNSPWSFKNAGIVLVNENGKIEVLEEGDDMVHAAPVVNTFRYGLEQLGLKKTVDYQHWFDIVSFNDSINHAVSAYELPVTLRGKAKLDKLGVPGRFPAVIMHKGDDYTFYYLCGDYSGKPISYKTSRLVGIQNFSSFIKDNNQKRGGDFFFYKFYLPLVSTIIKNYSQN